MEVSGFFSSNLLSNDEYKNQKKQNLQSPNKGSPVEKHECFPDPVEMNKGIQELLKDFNETNKKKENKTTNQVTKPKKVPTTAEVYEKYIHFKNHILSQFVEYDKFMESLNIASETTVKHTQLSNNTKTPASSSTKKSENTESSVTTAAANNSPVANTDEPNVKRVPPMTLTDTYVLFTDIKTSFKSTKFSDFLKITTSGSSNTRKWYRKYFRYFFVVDGLLQFIDPEHKLPIEVLKDFEDLMIQKAITPLPGSQDKLEGENDEIKATEDEKSSTPLVQQQNLNRFSHEMFLSGTNMNGYSIFMTSVKKEDFYDFVKSLHQKIIAKYGPSSINPELSDSYIDVVYDKLLGTRRPEPLMALQEYKCYNSNW